MNNSIYNLIAEDKDLIVYRKSLRRAAGSVTATILLQQMIHRMKDKERIYKFKDACNHEKYREGDSWKEELGFSVKEFDTALKKIGTKLSNGKKKEDVLRQLSPNAIVIYWTDRDRVTWYELNKPLLNAYLSVIYLNDQSAFSKITEGDLLKYLPKGHLHDLTESPNRESFRDIPLEKKPSESVPFSVQTEQLGGESPFVSVFYSDDNVIPEMRDILIKLAADGIVEYRPCKDNPDWTWYHWVDNGLLVERIPFGLAEKYGYKISEPPEEVNHTSLEEAVSQIPTQGAEAATLELDALIMGEEDEFANVFGDNPRQDEIDQWEDRKPITPDELLLHAITGGVGVGSDTRHWERIINESKWKLNESQVRAIAVFQTATEGFFAIPTAKQHRGRWKNAINQHLDEAAFEGLLEELYVAVWEELGPDIKSGKLTLYSTPGSFTSQMYSAMQRMAFEDSSEGKPLTDEQGALIL